MSYRYNRRRKTGLWTLIAVLAILVVGSCSTWTYFRDIQTGQATFVVTRLTDQATDKGHQYLVFTDHGVYQDTDNLFQAKFDSSDLWNKLRVGVRYTCTYTGWRLPLLSSYRNLIDCHRS